MNGTPQLKVIKQSINISIEPDINEIKGYTDITFECSKPRRTLFLNAKQMKILSVTIDEKPIDFQYIDSHEALMLNRTAPGNPIVRDATHFAAVCEIVNQSPDLIIPYRGLFPVTVRIHFQLNKDSTAIIRQQNCFVTDNRVDGPSGWFPCIDSRFRRSFYSLTITCPDNLTCIGPGESSLSTMDSLRTKSMLFKISFPVSPDAIGFAVGPFNTSTIPSSDVTILFLTTECEDYKNTLLKISDYTIKILAKFGIDDPPALYSFVFLPFITELQLFPNLFFMPPSMVIPVRSATAWIDVQPRILEALFAQMINYTFYTSGPQDEWIKIGLIKYLADVYLSETNSKSAALERRWKDINKLMVEDIHEKVTLHSVDPATGYPFEDEYLKIKSKLLMNMISTSMNNSSEPDQKILLLFTGATRDQTPNTPPHSTKFMADIQRFAPSINFKNFKEQWLEANGMPIFSFNFSNENRKRSIKFVLYQSPSTQTKVPIFTGQMIVYMQDMHQPYECQVQIENKIQLQQMQYLTFRNKTNKATFEFQNKEKITVAVRSVILWITIDSPHAWICKVRSRIPGFMLITQLKLMRNVYTEHEIISSIEDYCNETEVKDTLFDLMKNEQKQLYYTVRGHIACALCKFSNEQNEFKPSNDVMDYYKSHYGKYDQRNFVPNPHDFSDLNKHLFQLEIVRAVSIVRDSLNHTPPPIIDFLKILLDQSSNDGNFYTEERFIAAVETSMGRVSAEKETEYEEMAKIIQQKMSLFASFHEIGSVIARKGYIALTAISIKAGKLIYDPLPTEIRAVILEGNFSQKCRVSLFKCLLFLAFYGYQVSFPELIDVLRKVVKKGQRDFAAQCIRKFYRFVHNSVLSNNEDRFKAFLLSLPKDTKKEAIVKKIAGGEYRLNVAETIWEMLTVEAKHHNILRSETLRLYTTLYGTDIPFPYTEARLQRNQEQTATKELAASCVNREIRVNFKQVQQTPPPPTTTMPPRMPPGPYGGEQQVPKQAPRYSNMYE